MTDKEKTDWYKQYEKTIKTLFGLTIKMNGFDPSKFSKEDLEIMRKVGII